jgi:hypothetical protein
VQGLGLRPVLDVVKSNRAGTALYERHGWTCASEITYRFSTSPIELWVYVGPAPPPIV